MAAKSPDVQLRVKSHKHNESDVQLPDCTGA